MDTATISAWGSKLIDICTSLGIKIVLALLILIIGRIVIKKLLKGVGKIKGMDKVDPAVRSFLMNFIKIAQSGGVDSMILCVPNGGAINGLRDSDVVEITCDIKDGEAIRTKSRTKAIEALTLHPLVASYSLATALVDAYLEHNKDYIGAWV